MAPAVSTVTPRLSDFIRDRMVADAFRRAERDNPPAPLGVASEPVAPRAPGAVVRHPVEA